MKELQLTQNQIALVDDDEYTQLSSHAWYAFWNGRNFYAASCIKGRVTYMHKILCIVEDGQEVDHANGNTLDNRKENLRPATSSQNKANKYYQRGTSKYKGVSWSKERELWHAHINCQRKQYNLGNHLSEEDAALAYDKKARELFGEFAYLNFPEVTHGST